MKIKILFKSNMAARGCGKYLERVPSKIFIWIYNYLYKIFIFLYKYFILLCALNTISRVFFLITIILKPFLMATYVDTLWVI